VTSLAGSTAVAAPPPLQPEIGIRPLGVLTDGGATLAPSLVVRCAPSDHMREGFASVGQGDIALLTGFEVVCDGRRHVTQAVYSVSAESGGPFLSGRADVSAIIFDEATGTSVAEATRSVLLKPWATQRQRLTSSGALPCTDDERPDRGRGVRRQSSASSVQLVGQSR
jgi:hypothetical protein